MWRRRGMFGVAAWVGERLGDEIFASENQKNGAVTSILASGTQLASADDQNRLTRPTATTNILPVDEGVALNPSPTVAVASMT